MKRANALLLASQTAQLILNDMGFQDTLLEKAGFPALPMMNKLPDTPKGKIESVVRGGSYMGETAQPATFFLHLANIQGYMPRTETYERNVAWGLGVRGNMVVNENHGQTFNEIRREGSTMRFPDTKQVPVSPDSPPTFIGAGEVMVGVLVTMVYAWEGETWELGFDAIVHSCKKYDGRIVRLDKSLDTQPLAPAIQTEGYEFDAATLRRAEEIKAQRAKGVEIEVDDDAQANDLLAPAPTKRQLANCPAMKHAAGLLKKRKAA